MHKKNIGFLLAGLLLLPGCGLVTTYKSKPLKSIDINTGYHESKKGVQLRVKRLTREDKKQLFGSRSKKLYTQNNEPIEVICFSLHNLSSVDYSLSSIAIDLEIMPHQKIMKLMKTSTIGRFMGAVGSLLGLGLVNVAAWYGFSGLIKSRVPAAALIVPGFWFAGVQVASTAAGKYAAATEDSFDANRKIDQDLAEKTSGDIASGDILMAAGDAYEWLIFVKYPDYNPQFSLTLREKNNRHNKIVFDVDLSKPFTTEQTWKSPIAEYENE